MVLLNERCCKKCGEENTNISLKWCKPCSINYLKMNWTSGNEKINDFIQEKQSKIDGPLDNIFEWIPFNQFDVIKRIGEDSSLYLAIWKDGPLYYYNEKWIRISDKKVVLKYVSQNAIEILNKV